MSEGKAVYRAISAVAGEMSKHGIAKDSKNQGQGYMFRGIDSVYNALAPALVKHKLVILPRMLSCNVIERTNQKGNALFYTTVEAEFDLVATEDGSSHTVRTFGEAMDSGDKSCNKAMSAAYKYAAFQTFCIPTEGDNDADAHTHEVAPAKQTEKPKEAASDTQAQRDKAFATLAEFAAKSKFPADKEEVFWNCAKDALGLLRESNEPGDFTLEQLRKIYTKRAEILKAAEEEIDAIPL